MQSEGAIFQVGGLKDSLEIIDDKLLWQVYCEDNFQIIETPQKNSDKTAVIYFSSNGLYDVKQKCFEKKVIEENRFEWLKNKVPFADKHIFVRDIFLISYYFGINKQVNSIEKLRDFLREQTKGYRLITLGSSGGGYAAALFAALLGADYALSFSGQFDVVEFNRACEMPVPYINPDDKESTPYLNLSEVLAQSRVPVFYFVGADNKFDQNDIRIAQTLSNVRVFLMDNDKHGMPLDKRCLRKLISLNIERLEQLHQKFAGRKINWITFGWALKGIAYVPAIVLNYFKTAEKKLRKFRKKLSGKK